MSTRACEAGIGWTSALVSKRINSSALRDALLWSPRLQQPTGESRKEVPVQSAGNLRFFSIGLLDRLSCHYICPHFSPIQPQWVLTLISLQNPPRRPLFPPPALRAQTSSECEPWEHSRSSSVGDIHWQLAKNGQEQGRLATPDGTFSLPYDATIPCRAKVGIQGEFRKLWG